MIVSGGGGYYVKTGVTELDRDKYPVGTQMRIQSWEHGEVYGTVAEISDTPVPSSIIPITRPATRTSASTPCSLRSMRDSPLREDEWVDVYFNAASTASEDACALRHASSGRMTAEAMSIAAVRISSCTNSMSRRASCEWGYTEIKSGLTVDDWIAFPYGKDVKENAETIESDNSG